MFSSTSTFTNLFVGPEKNQTLEFLFDGKMFGTYLHNGEWKTVIKVNKMENR